MKLFCWLAFVGALLCASNAAAGTLERKCDRIGSAYGANAYDCNIWFDGEIVEGDAQRIAISIQSAPHHVGMVFFNSPGGNPFEALKISDILNANFVMFSTALCPRSLGKCMKGDGGKFCASACALAFITANQRIGSEVYIHRITFPAPLFAGLSSADAQVVYDRRMDHPVAELRSRRVAASQIQMMVDTPSAALTKLPEDFPTESPWLEEWLAAKCGVPSYTTVTPSIACQADAIVAEGRRVQGKD